MIWPIPIHHLSPTNRQWDRMSKSRSGNLHTFKSSVAIIPHHGPNSFLMPNLHIYNHWPHSITNQSLFYLMMGYEPCALPLIISDTAIPAVEDHLKTLSTACNEALAAHELAQQVMSFHSWRGFKPFAKGDKVWLKARNLKHLIINPKFAPKREGLFTITKVLSPIVDQLCLPKTWKIHPSGLLCFSLISLVWKWSPRSKLSSATLWPYRRRRRIRNWEDLTPLWNSVFLLVPDLMERIFGQRRFLGPWMGFETHQVHSHFI